MRESRACSSSLVPWMYVDDSLMRQLHRISRVDPRIESAGERPHEREPFVHQHARHTGG